MGKAYRIVFNNESFERQKQRNNFSFKSKKFNGVINEMNTKVEELDRYDDFEKLKIAPEYYENVGGDYGIVKTKEHGRNVIYDYQLSAAKDFLKDLRGFGLLADTVGSGKTFEACVVLSELAQRKKIRSLLFIVPKQVITDWKKTVEKYFGLGKDVLLHIKSPDEEKDNGRNGKRTILLDDKELEVENIGGYKVPRRPVIISDEDFSILEGSITNYLFDCIVVDEAHHLCDEKDVYSQTMNRISKMIQIKKKAQRPYCLLLSATPHSGNLENMFKLWYFIRCTGGNPDDFINDNKTEDYNKEKKYYLDVVCRKAKTVMQFIEIVKRYEVENTFKDKYGSFVSTKYSNLNEYYLLPDSKKNEIVNEFLGENEEISKKVTKTVASAYHNGVLRTIMIRNPQSVKDSSERRHIEKNIVNYLFFPTKKEIKNSIKVSMDELNNKEFEVYLKELDTDKAIKFDNHFYSLSSFTKEYANDVKYSNFYARLVRNILTAIDDIDNDKSDDPVFEKKQSFKYYEQRMRECESRIENKVIIQQYKKDDIFTDKYEVVSKLLTKHNKERVIIFFDYDAKRNRDELEEKNVINKFIKKIESSEFSSRVILGKVKSDTDKQKIENEFNKKSNAILVVKDESLTEGTNLQASSIIINFEITPNPVALDQRIGRVFRLGQTNDVIVYSLAHMNILEGYSLMYFSSIGLLTSNSGDATIIAGSNSENMVAIRCRCGNVKLMSQDEYNYAKENSQDALLCDDLDCQKTGKKYMTEISIENYRCDECGSTLIRSDEDDLYRCISASGYSKSPRCMVSTNGSRMFSCSKICTMWNCNKFRKWEENGFLCPVIGAYRENKYITAVSLQMICSSCERRDVCPKDCRYEIGDNNVNKCRNCVEASCSPKPHTIQFNEKHEAKCPNCRNGIIRPVVAASFGQYVRKAWDFKNDKGASFCDNLGKEADKVAEIKRILDCDGRGDSRHE